MSSFDSGNTSAANARPNSADAEPIDVSIAEAPKEDTSYDRSTSNSASTAGLSHADDPNAHPETREARAKDPEVTQGRLEAQGPAETTTSNKFTASLEAAKAAQEESGSTSI